MIVTREGKLPNLDTERWEGECRKCHCTVADVKHFEMSFDTNRATFVPCPTTFGKVKCGSVIYLTKTPEKKQDAPQVR